MGTTDRCAVCGVAIDFGREQHDAEKHRQRTTDPEDVKPKQTFDELIRDGHRCPEPELRAEVASLRAEHLKLREALVEAERQKFQHLKNEHHWSDKDVAEYQERFPDHVNITGTGLCIHGYHGWTCWTCGDERKARAALSPKTEGGEQ